MFASAAVDSSVCLSHFERMLSLLLEIARLLLSAQGELYIVAALAQALADVPQMKQLFLLFPNVLLDACVGSGDMLCSARHLPSPTHVSSGYRQVFRISVSFFE